MRHIKLTVALATSAAMICGLLTATAAVARSPGIGSAHIGAAAASVAPVASCFSNLAGDTGAVIVSQNFETPNDAFDSAGADDLNVAGGCVVDSIDVVGQYFNGTGPADSENVTFYSDAGGLPGAVVSNQTVAGTDTAGSFHIPLAPVTLLAGTTYWLSVQANMDFSVGGEWGWENTATPSGNPAAWQNPGDGFAVGCTTWANMQTCLGGAAPGPDFMFSVNGTTGDPSTSTEFGGYTFKFNTTHGKRGPNGIIDYSRLPVWTTMTVPPNKSCTAPNIYGYSPGLSYSGPDAQGLVEAGIGFDCPAGVTSYYAAYRITPAEPVRATFSIVPGDRVYAKIYLNQQQQVRVCLKKVLGGVFSFCTPWMVTYDFGTIAVGTKWVQGSSSADVQSKLLFKDIVWGKRELPLSKLVTTKTTLVDATGAPLSVPSKVKRTDFKLLRP